MHNSRGQYSPLIGRNFDDNSQGSASSEEGVYQGASCSLNADPKDIKWRNGKLTVRGIMSRDVYTEGLPTPITFADQDVVSEKSPAPSSFSDSFEQSLKSVSDYGGINDGQFSFVSTVSVSTKSTA